MERTCVALLAIPADAAHQLLVDGPILPVHLIDLAFFGTLRHGDPLTSSGGVAIPRRSRRSNCESLGMRISACASTIPAPSSLRSVSMSIKRAALSATAVNVALNIGFSRSATLVWSDQRARCF